MLLSLAAAAEAADGNPLIIHFDTPKPLPSELHFDQPRELVPEPGDFELVHYDLMSNDLGERWALMTFRNTSTGQRLLKNQHVVATFANGAQAFAQNLDKRLAGGARYTQAVFFGTQKFPIIEVDMR